MVEDGGTEKGPIVARDGSLRLQLQSGRSPRTCSTILHALGLARIALLSATDRVATVIRVEQELAFFCEELRITDARMQRVPPRHRPRYPSVERLAILALCSISPR